MAFTLSIYPWVHIAKYSDDGWTAHFVEKGHRTPAEEAALSDRERTELVEGRNSFPELPLVNYTSQYGLGCFEGLKAFPQKGAGLKLFRPDRNAARMARSMRGLMMPAIDEDLLVDGIIGTVKKNAEIGFTMAYDPAWEDDHWQSGGAVYVRPFSYSEPGIGVNLSEYPWVITVNTPVTAYFDPGRHAAVTTDMVRATPLGTGWIKCDSNYVIPTLAKKKALDAGYMEAIFLDARNGENIEEGSSCNFFCLLDNDSLVTPSLEDTILPGITRESVITLARDRGITVEERTLSITEVMEAGRECFVTGTAAGIAPLGSITHHDRKRKFSSVDKDSLSTSLLKELKGIQYGELEDRFGWMVTV